LQKTPIPVGNLTTVIKEILFIRSQEEEEG